MLPSHVRAFWVLSVAIVAYWTLSTEWYIAFPSAHDEALLQKLHRLGAPAAHVELLRRMGIIVPMTGASFWGVLTLGTAWFATFRRQNWARWSFAGVFMFREVLLPCIFVAYVFLVPVYSALYRQGFWQAFWKSTVREWSDPQNYLIPALTIAAIVAVFTGNANDWFRRPTGKQRIRRVRRKLNAADLTADNYDDLNRAIILYSRVGVASWPQHDKDAVVAEFGAEEAKLLIEQIERLIDEMLRIDVDWSSHTLASGSRYVRDEMNRRYPLLSDKALDALAWQYAFNMK